MPGHSEGAHELETQKLMLPCTGSSTVLFNGLRVRMGVATGTLVQGTSVRASAILQQAKLVSDAGAGGQILMDETTFAAVNVGMSKVKHLVTGVASASWIWSIALD